jgi:hypothetical protein
MFRGSPKHLLLSDDMIDISNTCFPILLIRKYFLYLLLVYFEISFKR